MSSLTTVKARANIPGHWASFGFLGVAAAAPPPLLWTSLKTLEAPPETSPVALMGGGDYYDLSRLVARSSRKGVSL